MSAQPDDGEPAAPDKLVPQWSNSVVPLACPNVSSSTFLRSQEDYNEMNFSSR
jgi:hypothetical protein